MASTKNLRTIQSSTSNSAGSTTTGTAVDLTTKYGGLLTVKITNGGTGPTIACSAYVQTSGDNSNWKAFTTLTAGTANSAIAEWSVRIPAEVMYVRVVFVDNTGQAVTVEAFLQELTTI